MDPVDGWRQWKTSEGLDISVLNDPAHLAYVLNVLDLAQHVAVRERLRWRVVDGRAAFSLTIHDAFRWSGRDVEEVDPEDVPSLRQAWQDLWAIWEADPRSQALLDLPILYAARRRHTAPQRDWLVAHAAWHPHRDAWEPVRKLLVELG